MLYGFAIKTGINIGNVHETDPSISHITPEPAQKGILLAKIPSAALSRLIIIRWVLLAKAW